MFQKLGRRRGRVEGVAAAMTPREDSRLAESDCGVFFGRKRNGREG